MMVKMGLRLLLMFYLTLHHNMIIVQAMYCACLETKLLQMRK